MKTKLFYLLLLFVVTFTACEEDKESDEFCSNPEAECPDGTEIEASSCCTNTGCYWTYEGTDIECDGTDCSDVLDEIVNDACVAPAGTTKSTNADLEQLKAELAMVTQQLLAEARQAAACN